MIDVEGISKRRGRRLVVEDVTFSIQPGRVTGFLGPNGAGKSTTLRLVLGLDRPDSGRALVAGVPYRRLRRPLTVVGSLLDADHAHRSRTARAHLQWLTQSNAIPRRRVDEVLEMVGLASVARRRVGSYSFGMKQRLGLASALLGAPSALLLDEPMNGLDPEGIVWLRNLLRQLGADGCAVLVSSHLISEVAQLADDLVVIAGGTIRAHGALEQLVAEHASLEEAYFALTRDATPFSGRPPAA